MAGKFVEWWNNTVSARHGLNRHNIDNSDLNCLSKNEAEKLSNVSQVQVSRWRKKLSDVDKYRAQILGAAYKAANLNDVEDNGF